MNPNFSSFQKQVLQPIRFSFFLLTNLPVAWIVGLKLKNLEQDSATVAVSYHWWSKNPFRSIYFAALAMAAELSTGILAFGHIYKMSPPISMLVIGMESKFHKKATGKIMFTSNDGNAIADCISNAIQTGEGKTLVCNTIGKNENGEIVATFSFTWSFKSKKV